MGPTVCTETSASNYHYSQHNIREERTSHLLRGGSLKPRKEKKSVYFSNAWFLPKLPPEMVLMNIVNLAMSAI
jgi:hypothetical protein